VETNGPILSSARSISASVGLLALLVL
jgi:hypothetical protein